MPRKVALCGAIHETAKTIRHHHYFLSNALSSTDLLFSHPTIFVFAFIVHILI
jgi:hypothetical protein